MKRKKREEEAPRAAKKKAKPEPLNQPFSALKALKKKLEDEAAAKKQGKADPKKPARSDARGERAQAKKEQGATTEEDALSFHRLMSGVVPLDSSRATRLPRSQELPQRSAAAEIAQKRATVKTLAEQEQAEVHEHLRALVEGQTRFEVEDDGRRVEGRRIDVPPSVLRKLRHGTLPIDARLDLHGMRGGEARIAVEGFLAQKRARGERCVLVVHGKGAHSPMGMPILRGEISAWLSQSAASEHVAAFATATANDGGEGALYVLLRVER